MERKDRDGRREEKRNGRTVPACVCVRLQVKERGRKEGRKERNRFTGFLTGRRTR